jgi:Rad3-related DNA helicase
VFETVIFEAIAHARMRQRITGVSAYFDYMRLADTVDSQKSKDLTITDKLAVNAASDNQSAANAIPNISLSHSKNLVRLFTSYYFVQILDLKI